MANACTAPKPFQATGPKKAGVGTRPIWISPGAPGRQPRSGSTIDGPAPSSIATNVGDPTPIGHAPCASRTTSAKPALPRLGTLSDGNGARLDGALRPPASGTGVALAAAHGPPCAAAEPVRARARASGKPSAAARRFERSMGESPGLG